MPHPPPSHQNPDITATAPHTNPRTALSPLPLTRSPIAVVVNNAHSIATHVNTTNTAQRRHVTPSLSTIPVHAPATPAPAALKIASITTELHELTVPPYCITENSSRHIKSAPEAHTAAPPVHTTTDATSSTTAITGRMSSRICLRKGTPRTTTTSHAQPPPVRDPGHFTTCLPTSSFHTPRTRANSHPHLGQIWLRLTSAVYRPPPSRFTFACLLPL